MVDYKNMTDEEIKKLAEDMYKGLVFTDRHIQNPHDIYMVFIPIIFIKKEQADEFNNNPPGMIYEYMDKAGNMAINGMPTFFSCNIISQEDANKVIEKYNAIIGAVNKV